MAARVFVTDSGAEVPAITTEQMREVDRLATEELGPNLFQMMENAGRSLALTVVEELDTGVQGQRIVVLAGTGGNAGGGICAARHLTNRGIDATVVVDEDRLAGVPAEQLRVYRGTPGRVATIAELPSLAADLVVDAVIGYGLAGVPRGAALEMITWAGATTAPKLSLDVPSGIDSTTGAAPGAHIHAATTMTLALPKTGLDVAAVGDLWLADLGIPAEVYRRAAIDVPATLFRDGYRVPIRAR
jgi:NAD(P)H-hydrate epimerase